MALINPRETEELHHKFSLLEVRYAEAGDGLNCHFVIDSIEGEMRAFIESHVNKGNLWAIQKKMEGLMEDKSNLSKAFQFAREWLIVEF